MQRHVKVLNEVLQVVSDVRCKPHNRRRPFPPTSACQPGIYVHKTTCVDNDAPVLGIRALKVAQSPVQSITESTSQRLMNKLGRAPNDRQPRQLTFEIGARDSERVEPHASPYGPHGLDESVQQLAAVRLCNTLPEKMLNSAAE